VEVIKAEYTSPGSAGKRGFEDLECYILALDIIVNAYELARNLPREEKYDLAVQIRRSAKSITANIAEGYGRYHYLDSLKYYSIARGELNETLAHFINARVLGYIDQESFEQIYALIRKTEVTLNGFMNYIRKKRSGEPEYGNHFISEAMEGDYRQWSEEYTVDKTWSKDD
jgi:four helix bundle protein